MWLCFGNGRMRRVVGHGLRTADVVPWSFPGPAFRRPGPPAKPANHRSTDGARRVGGCSVTVRVQEDGLESAGDEVIMSIAGHVSRAIISRYSHVRMEA